MHLKTENEALCRFTEDFQDLLSFKDRIKVQCGKLKHPTAYKTAGEYLISLDAAPVLFTALHLNRFMIITRCLHEMCHQMNLIKYSKTVKLPFICSQKPSQTWMICLTWYKSPSEPLQGLWESYMHKCRHVANNCLRRLHQIFFRWRWTYQRDGSIHLGCIQWKVR